MAGGGGDGAVSTAWCVVANVATETVQGEDIRRGLKHFAPGTKVWVLPPQWGDGGEHLVVVGRHRGQGRLARMVVGRRHLVGFRVRGVYSPAVYRELTRPWKRRSQGNPRLWGSRDEAEHAAQAWTGAARTR